RKSGVFGGTGKAQAELNRRNGLLRESVLLPPYALSAFMFGVTCKRSGTSRLNISPSSFIIERQNCFNRSPAMQPRELPVPETWRFSGRTLASPLRSTLHG